MTLYEFLMSCVNSVTAKFSSTDSKSRVITDSVTDYDTCITNSLEKLKTEKVGETDLKVFSGVLFHHGCIKTVPFGGEFLASTVENSLGTTGFPLTASGVTRKDLFICRFVIDTKGFVTGEWKILCGEESALAPQTPSYTAGDIRNGIQSSSATDDCPIFEVTVGSTGIENVNRIPPVWKIETSIISDSANPVASSAIATALSGKISTEDLVVKSIEGKEGNFVELTAGNVTATMATIEHIESAYMNTSAIEARYAEIENLVAEKASIEELDLTNANIVELEAEDARITGLLADKASITSLEAVEAEINDLDATYATIDLANVEDGAITTAMIGTGVVGTAQIADGSITDAKIVGLTANKITAGTIDAADIEVINLKASNITVGTINGTQIANGAVDSSKLSSGVTGAISSAQETADGKNKIFYSANEPTATAVGDTWFDTDNGYAIHQWNGTAWVSGLIGTNALSYDVQETLNSVETIDENASHALESATEALSKAQNIEDRADSGEFDAITLKIDSSRGTVFKNNAVSTVLSVVIYHGSKRITSSVELASDLGSGACLQWKWQRLDESTFGTISSSDSRLEDNGFRFNLTPNDVDTKCVFMCDLVV